MPRAEPFPFAALPRLTRLEARAASLFARGIPGVSLSRLLTSLEGSLGARAVVTPFAAETWPAGSPFVRPDPSLVAVVIGDGLASAAQRLALELDPGLAGFAIDRALGAAAPEPRLAPGPISDGERGTLAYLAATALAGTGLRVLGVVSTVDALAHALGDDGRGLMLALPARVELAGLTGWARLWVTPTRAVDAGAALVDPALELSLSLIAAIATLSAPDVAALGPGDVVIPDAWTARPEGAHWSGVLTASSGYGGPTLTLAAGASITYTRAERAPLAPPAHPIEGSPTMSADDSKLNVADVPVELSIEVARLALTAGELSALVPGAVLVSGVASGQPVTLRAGARVVARGELVVVDGELGVRIL